MRSRLVKTAVVAALIFVVTYALAATMEITGVGVLGGGEAEVTSPANVDSVKWVFSAPGGERRKVVGVSLSFDGNLNAGTTIYVELLDSSETVISEGSETLTSDLLADDSTVVDVSPSAFPNEIAKIAVTVVS